MKGYAQVVGLDYGDKFAPVARHDTIMLLLNCFGSSIKLGAVSFGCEIGILKWTIEEGDLC